MISFISSFEMINVVVVDSNILLWIAASVAVAAAANPNGIKMLLANGLSTLPIKGKPVLSNSPKTLLKNLSDCPILGNWVFDNFTLADEPFRKDLGSLQTCVLTYSLESPTKFDESFKVTSALFFIPDFNS